MTALFALMDSFQCNDRRQQQRWEYIDVERRTCEARGLLIKDCTAVLVEARA